MKARETTTIAAPRADWTLLRMHYLRVVAPLAAVCFGTELTFMAASALAGRFRGMSGNPAQGLDLIALALALFVALPVGAAVFSRPFKEQHILLFHALPLSRLRQWTVFATASLLALLTVVAGLALLRPGAARMLVDNHTLKPFLVLTVISFATGLCFALIFVRTFAVYLSAYIAAIAVPAFLAFALFAPYLAYRDLPREMQRSLAVYGAMGTALQPPPSFPLTKLWIGVALLVLGLAAASAAFYVRGEMTLARVQIGNALSIVGGVLLLAMVAMVATHAFPPSERGIAGVGVSPDGRRVAVRLMNFAGPWQSEVRIHDLVSGRTAKRTSPGLLDFAWTPRGDIVASFREMSPLRRLFYLRPARDRIERWSAEGVKLDAETYEGKVLDFGPNAVVVRNGDQAVAYELKDGIRGRELFRAPTPEEIFIGSGRILFRSTAFEPRLWNITAAGASEVPRVPVANRNDFAAVFEGEFYPVREALIRKIESTWPVPRASGDRVGYVTGFDSSWVFAIVGHPSTSTATLHVFDATAKRWKKITDAVPMLPEEMPKEVAGKHDRMNTASLKFSNGSFVQFAERSEGRILHRLYDAASGATATLYEHAADDPRSFSMKPAQFVSPSGRVLTVEADGRAVAEILWRDGRFDPVPMHHGGALEAIWPDGTQVRRLGGLLTVIDPRGKARHVNLEAQ